MRLAGFGYIVVALAILLRRPNRMTWGLFLYLVSATDVTFYRFPDGLWPFVIVASNLLDVAGTVGPDSENPDATDREPGEEG